MCISDWFSILIRGGTRSLNPAEESLLAVVADMLPDEEGEMLRKQIEEVDLVQRPQPKRMVICFYGKNPQSRQFDLQDDDVCLARVTWMHLGGKKAKVKVMLYKGRLKNFEGHIPERPIFSADCTVELWPSLNSNLPQAIDRLEHGR